MIANILDKAFTLILTSMILTILYFCFDSAIDLANRIQDNEARQITLDSLMVEKGKNPCRR